MRLGNLIALGLGLGVIGLVASTRKPDPAPTEPIRNGKPPTTTPDGTAVPNGTDAAVLRVGNDVIINLRGQVKLPEPYLSEAVSGALVRVTSLDANGTTFAGTVNRLFADVSRPNEEFMIVPSPGFTLANLPIADVLEVNPVLPAPEMQPPVDPIGPAETPNAIGCTSLSSSIPEAATLKGAELLAIPPAMVTKANVEEMRVLANAIDQCGSALGAWDLRDQWAKALRARIIETAPGV